MLQLTQVHNVVAISSHNKFLVHHETYITAYSLDLLGRVAMQMSPPKPLDASRESITSPSDHVFLMKVSKFGKQNIRKILVTLEVCIALTKTSYSHVWYTWPHAGVYSPS